MWGEVREGGGTNSVYNNIFVVVGKFVEIVGSM